MKSKLLMAAVPGLVLALAAGAPWRVSPEGTAAAFREKFGAIYRNLSELYPQGRKVDLKEAAPFLDALERLTTEEIESRLDATPPPAAPELSASLNESIVEAMFGQSVAERRKRVPDVNYASALSWGRPEDWLYVVGFQLLNDGTSRNVVEGFRKGPKGYGLAARAGEELDGHSLRLAALSSPSREKVRFLAYGNGLTDNHVRLLCTLYEFDGKTLRPLWQRSGLFEGAVEVSGDFVILAYQDFDRYRKGTPPYYVRDEFSQTAEGLVLHSSRPSNTPPPSPW